MTSRPMRASRGLGIEMIQAMNRVGMVLDLSHVGERTSLEALEVSSKPVLFSALEPPEEG